MAACSHSSNATSSVKPDTAESLDAPDNLQCAFTALAVHESAASPSRKKCEGDASDDESDGDEWAVVSHARTPVVKHACVDKLELRDYQEELAEAALKGRNCIVCAPPLAGKTIVAVKIVLVLT